MRKDKVENNQVIIIGGNHHNTLAIIRCLGKRNVPFIVLVHDSEKKIDEIMLKYSRFTKEIFVVKDCEIDIKDWLLDNIIKNKRQIIIPCSDLAEYTIDNNYATLDKYYILPGFKNKPGLVCNLMNKYNQKQWAEENDILMAKSWDIKKDKNKFEIVFPISIPCIIKPNISAFGNKSDIRICNTKEELDEEIRKFNDTTYNELIVQEFIEKDYEICAIGCITENKKHYGGIIKKIRENPPKGGGSLTFAKFIYNKKIEEKVNKVLEILTNEGYNGLYDIEFLVCKNDIYLNEINFRHSGNGYALLKSGLEAPYIWYLDKANIKFPKNIILNTKKIYFIDDFNEISLLKRRGINIFTFIHDFLKAKAHSVFSLSDFNVFKFRISKAFKDRRSKK